MIEGIKIAVTSYKDSEESANLAAQISFFIRRDRKSTRLNSSHWNKSRMPSSA